MASSVAIPSPHISSAPLDVSPSAFHPSLSQSPVNGRTLSSASSMTFPKIPVAAMSPALGAGASMLDEKRLEKERERKKTSA